MLSCQKLVGLVVSGRDRTLGNSSHAVLIIAVQLMEAMPVHGGAESSVSVNGSRCCWKDGTNPLVLSLFVTVTSILSPQSALINGPGYPPDREFVSRWFGIRSVGNRWLYLNIDEHGSLLDVTIWADPFIHFGDFQVEL